jgi:hypothetical protein
MLLTFLNVRRDMLWLDLTPEFIEKNESSERFDILFIYGLMFSSLLSYNLIMGG